MWVSSYLPNMGPGCYKVTHKAHTHSKDKEAGFSQGFRGGFEGWIEWGIGVFIGEGS
jgi:hypothetical protein